jgi:hypothetical protein
MDKQFSTRQICLGIGTSFLLLGAIGLMSPDFAGGHFSLTVNMLHIASGFAAFVVARSKTDYFSYVFSLGGFIFTAALALIGIVIGAPGISHVGLNQEDPFLIIVIPRIIDHLINTGLAILFAMGIYNYNNPKNSKRIDKESLDRFENEGGAVKKK